MKIAGFTLAVVDMPLRIPVAHALATRKAARNVLVAAADEQGRTGWGESCPRPYVTGETIESARDALAESLLPDLVGADLADFDQAVARLTASLDGLPRNRHAAFCAAETAVLDLAARRFGRSVGDVFGPVRRDTVRYSGVIAADSEAALEAYAGFFKRLGVAEVKIKMGADLDVNLSFLEASRRILGPDVELRIDANCAWAPQEALHQLEAMARYELAGVEQPVAADDFEAMKTVTAAGLLPVVADESLVTLEDARRLAGEHACDVFNIRISKCGGLINAGRIDRIAREAGLRCQLGAQVGETGILSAAGRHYATRCGDIGWCEGSYDSMLLEEGLSEPDITIGPGGLAPALAGTGWGICVNEERVAEFASERITIS